MSDMQYFISEIFNRLKAMLFQLTFETPTCLCFNDIQVLLKHLALAPLLLFRNQPRLCQKKSETTHH